MSKKYYRVLKDLPAVDEGAILEDVGNGYAPISDIWNNEGTDPNGTKFASYAIEHQPEWFERVYETSIFGKAAYATKEAAQALAKKMFRP